MTTPRERQKIVVAVCGAPGAGKSTMLHQLIHRQFEQTMKSTIGIDTKFYDLPATSTVIEIRDICGQDSASVNNKAYFRGVQAAAVVCDASKPASIDAGFLWYNEARDKVKLPDGRDVPLILVFNKMDLIIEPDKREEELRSVAAGNFDVHDILFTSALRHDDMVRLVGRLASIHVPIVAEAPRPRLQPIRRKKCEC